jgi:hypothetical protein
MSKTKTAASEAMAALKLFLAQKIARAEDERSKFLSKAELGTEGLQDALSWNAVSALRTVAQATAAKSLLKPVNDGKWDHESLLAYATKQAFNGIQSINGSSSTDPLAVTETAARGAFWAEVAEFLQSEGAKPMDASLEVDLKETIEDAAEFLRNRTPIHPGSDLATTILSLDKILKKTASKNLTTLAIVDKR